MEARLARIVEARLARIVEAWLALAVESRPALIVEAVVEVAHTVVWSHVVEVAVETGASRRLKASRVASRGRWLKVLAMGCWLAAS